VRREAGLGGAASVAADVAALGATAECIGIVGQDEAGRELRERLEARGVRPGEPGGVRLEGLCPVAARPTTVKTRLVGLAQHRHRQQLVRMDDEDAAPIDAAVERPLLAALRRVLGGCRILCIQDYGKGVVTPSLARQAIGLAAETNVRVIVDPMRSRETGRYAGAWLATPNRTETELVIGRPLPRVAAVRAAGAEILAAFGTTHVCVTLDAEGCALIGPAGSFEHLPTQPRDVYDVTGAGDAVLAALAVALACGAELREAAALANVAGGLEVEKFGCVPVTREEMIGEILLEHRERLGKRRAAAELIPELARRRARGERIVFTNGCFDLLHRGHVEYLAFCRRQGDVVVVGLNSDESVRRQNKSPGRPIHPQDDRAALLAALEHVDYVVVFDEDTPARLIEAVQPDVLVKGADWAEKGVVGRELVEARGGRVAFAPLVEGKSTTRVIERIRSL
jgi:D-beta-D-heptose 7-phosphate kinase/D-beta-D-heptose 1-phosphate adenosyltransferase